MPDLHPTLARAAELLLSSVNRPPDEAEQAAAFAVSLALRTLVVVDAGELQLLQLKAAALEAIKECEAATTARLAAGYGPGWDEACCMERLAAQAKSDALAALERAQKGGSDG